MGCCGSILVLDLGAPEKLLLNPTFVLCAHNVDVMGVPPGRQADAVTAFLLMAGRCPSSTAARDRASPTVELRGHAP